MFVLKRPVKEVLVSSAECTARLRPQPKRYDPRNHTNPVTRNNTNNFRVSSCDWVGVISWIVDSVKTLGKKPGLSDLLHRLHRHEMQEQKGPFDIWHLTYLDSSCSCFLLLLPAFLNQRNLWIWGLASFSLQFSIYDLRFTRHDGNRASLLQRFSFDRV